MHYPVSLSVHQSQPNTLVAREGFPFCVCYDDEDNVAEEGATEETTDEYVGETEGIEDEVCSFDVLKGIETIDFEKHLTDCKTVKGKDLQPDGLGGPSPEEYYVGSGNVYMGHEGTGSYDCIKYIGEDYATFDKVSLVNIVSNASTEALVDILKNHNEYLM